MDTHKIILPDEFTDKYDYNRFGSSAKRVGQAVVDILKHGSQPTYTAEDIIDGYQHEFVKEFERCVSENKDKYDSPFYVLVLSHKEAWAENMVRNWFIARQTAPEDRYMISQYPHHMKTLYRIDKKGDINLEWVLPGLSDIQSIFKKPELYDKDLVKYCAKALAINID